MIAAVLLGGLLGRGHVPELQEGQSLSSGGLALVLFFGLGLLVIIRRDSSAKAAYVAAFAIRLAAALTVSLLVEFDDELGLHREATEVVLGNRSAASSGYVWAISVLYWLFGSSLLVAKAFNVFVGSMSIFVIEHAARLWGGHSAARRARIYAIVAPPLILVSAINLKEASTGLLLLLIVLLAATNPKKFVLAISFVTGVVITLYWWRGTSGALLGFAIAVASFVVRAIHLRRISTQRAVLVAAVSVIAAIVVMGGPFESFEENTIEDRLHSEYFQSRAAPTAAISTDLLARDKPFAPRNLAVQSTRILYAPSPAEVIVNPSGINLLHGATTTGWYIFCAWAVGGAFWLARRREFHVWIPVVALLVALASSVPLGVDVVRHRLIAAPVVVVIAACYPQRTWSASLVWFYWIGAALYAAVFLISATG